ncbi:MAG TPA: retropepsin-like aspartic protease [Fimbriimonas sp.]|nr:retropepsin-like aspartic protease [Fimbriimonas sp.]
MIAAIWTVVIGTHAQDPLEVEGVEIPISVPLVPHKRHIPVVEVMVEGQGPYRFGLDTCASGEGRINTAIAEALQCQKVGTVNAQDGTGVGGERAVLYRIDNLKVGGALFRGARLYAREGNRMSIDEYDRLDGILGFGLFKKLLLTLDFTHRRVQISRGRLSEGGGAVSMDLSHGIAQAHVQIADQDELCDIDSGNNGGLTLPLDLAQKLPLGAPLKKIGTALTYYNKFNIYGSTLKGEIQVGGQVMRNPSFSTADSFKRANVGFDVLKYYTVTFDQADGLLKLSRPGR